MGILNVTPDSFSDGGKYADSHAAAAHALRMAGEGADLIDMGAESSRPGSSPVRASEQLRRLLPVLKRFRQHDSRTPVSIDTCAAKVAEACLAEGATTINDISALRRDAAMVKLLAKSDCDIVLMHLRGTPRTMQRNPVYADVVSSILQFFEQRMAFCGRAGIAHRRLILDPGIGFGKTGGHNIEILQRLSEFQLFGRPLLIGVSRKNFLGALTGERDPARRDSASIAAALYAASKGASIVRVHDVPGHVAAFKIAAELADRRRSTDSDYWFARIERAATAKNAR